jgi:hypothetical protein
MKIAVRYIPSMLQAGKYARTSWVTSREVVLMWSI